MRTRRLRRWVVGLSAAALLVVGSIALANAAHADNSWSVSNTDTTVSTP
jgi:hypothetical protein